MELAEQHAVAEQIVHAESMPVDELGCLEMQQQQSMDTCDMCGRWVGRNHKQGY